MPSCMLRVVGSTKKIREFLERSNLKPSKIYWKGELGFPKSRGPNTVSGFNLPLSKSAGESIERQIRQASAFFRRNSSELERLKSFRFEAVVVDFGLYNLTSEDLSWPRYRLPAKFVALVGTFGFEIELSFYGEVENQSASP